MSILQTIGTATRAIGGLTVTLAATLERDDINGQLFLRVTGTIGGEVHERKHSIGSQDGVDALSGLTAVQIAALIQADLDATRQKVAQVLVTRASVMLAGTQLT